VLSCYDGLVVTGTLPGGVLRGRDDAVSQRERHPDLRLPQFAMKLRDRVRERAASLAAEAGVTIDHIGKAHIRKEQQGDEIILRELLNVNTSPHLFLRRITDDPRLSRSTPIARPDPPRPADHRHRRPDRGRDRRHHWPMRRPRNPPPVSARPPSTGPISPAGAQLAGPVRCPHRPASSRPICRASPGWAGPPARSGAAAAIAHRHKLAGHEPPTNQEGVKAVLRGIRRTPGTAKHGKAPATADVLTQMVALCPDNLLGKRDRALLALGFAGAFRRSEPVAALAEF